VTVSPAKSYSLVTLTVLVAGHGDAELVERDDLQAALLELTDYTQHLS